MQYKKRYKIIGVVILVLLVLIHLCLRIGWWLVGLPVDQREQWYGFNWIPFAGFIDFLKYLGLLDDLTMTKAEFEETIHGVNTARLQNFPMKLTDEDIENIYSSFILVK